MPQIIPIRDLRDTTKLSQMCNSSNEPIFITKNGYGDMVIMSLQVYEEQLYRNYMFEKITKAKEEADAGNLVDGESVMDTLKKKYAK